MITEMWEWEPNRFYIAMNLSLLICNCNSRLENYQLQGDSTFWLQVISIQSAWWFLFVCEHVDVRPAVVWQTRVLNGLTHPKLLLNIFSFDSIDIIFSFHIFYNWIKLRFSLAVIYLIYSSVIPSRPLAYMFEAINILDITIVDFEWIKFFRQCSNIFWEIPSWLPGQEAKFMSFRVS